MTDTEATANRTYLRIGVDCARELLERAPPDVGDSTNPTPLSQSEHSKIKTDVAPDRGPAA